jgi:D-alanyl-D-alanine carboxypeptidase
LLIASPQGRYLGAAGVRSVDDSASVKPSDRFEIGSNTKSFTVVLALQLQEEGKLSMDDALSEWLPQVTDRLPGSGRVTLRQLAGNSSGILDYADPLMQPLVDVNDQARLARYWSSGELVDFALEQGPLDFEPGVGWAYSSTNFILLGMVFAKASGQALETLYARNIFEPLGMKDSRYHAGVPDRNSQLPGHYQVPGSGLKDMTSWNTSQGGAAGAIISTAEDMERYARSLMGGKLFIRPETLSEMLAMRELDMTTGGLFMGGYALGVRVSNQC